MKTVQTTVRVPADLWAEVKVAVIRAQQADPSMSIYKWVEQALRERLKGKH